jgi:hypothetical protein
MSVAEERSSSPSATYPFDMVPNSAIFLFIVLHSRHKLIELIRAFVPRGSSSGFDYSQYGINKYGKRTSFSSIGGL